MRSFLVLVALLASVSACISDSGGVDGGDDAGGNDVVSPQTETLTVTLAGNGAGKVASNLPGIDCGTACTAQFAVGASVILTATPSTGSTFTGWSGGGCSGTAPCTVPLDAATTVTATFTLQKVQLTVTPQGSGSVKSNPSGIDCGGTCKASFDYGTQVTLSATPTPTLAAFTGWTGAGCTGTGACVVKLTAPVSVSATFSTLATWDPTWSVAGVTYSNGNLSISGNSANTKNVRTSFGVTKGKTYWEVTVDSGVATNDGGGLGICDSSMPNNTNYIGYSPNSLGWGYGTYPQYWLNWSGVTLNGQAPATSYANTGMVYMFALDMSTGNFWAGNDGTWYNGGDPSTNTAPAATGISGTVYSCVTFYASSGNAFTANFGGAAFKYPLPTGFQPGFFQ